jgi:hypothetical protein
MKNAKIWILPMAGYGRRCSELGACKAMIRIHDKYAIEHCLDGIFEHISDGDLIDPIMLWEHEENFGIIRLIEKYFQKRRREVTIAGKFVYRVQPGPAATVSFCSFLESPSYQDLETIVVNTDQHCEFEFPANDVYDAFMPLYINTTGKSSYATIRGDAITEIREKDMSHSIAASAGVYGFRHLSLLRECLKVTLQKQPHHKGEWYIGPAMNWLAYRGMIVRPTSVRCKYDLGNPTGIRKFIDARYSIN